MAKIFQLWELFLNLLKAFFPCAHKFIWKREAKDIVLSVGCCLPKPACFPRRSIRMYSSEWSPSTETCCSARAGMENILPSYAASFSRLFFFFFLPARRSVCSSLQHMNTSGSWGHELRLLPELNEPHAAPRGWQAVKSFPHSAEYFNFYFL